METVAEGVPMPATNVKAMKTTELVALYNRLTKKSIKKFSSRAAGEKQVSAVLAANGGKARVVRGKAGANKTLGRPTLSFAVELLGQGVSRLQPKSLRRQLLEWLEVREGKSATIEAIEAHFKRNMRGVVNKMEEKGWLKSLELK